MRESTYQRKLIEKIEALFPGCKIFKNDPLVEQGVPDLLILFQDKWAMLEVKASANARKRPNQDFYIRHYDDMSYAAFIYPENEREVLNDLQLAFGVVRPALVS